MPLPYPRGLEPAYSLQGILLDGCDLCTGSSFTFTGSSAPCLKVWLERNRVYQKGMYHKTTAVNFYFRKTLPTTHTPGLFTVLAYTAEGKSTSTRPYQYQSRKCYHSPQQVPVELVQMRSCKTQYPGRPRRTKTQDSACNSIR